MLLPRVVPFGCGRLASARRWRGHWLYGGDDYYHLMTGADAHAPRFALVQVPPPPPARVCVCVRVSLLQLPPPPLLSDVCVCVSAGARDVNGQTSLPRSSSSATRRARSSSLGSVARSRAEFAISRSYIVFFFFSISTRLSRKGFRFVKRVHFFLVVWSHRAGRRREPKIIRSGIFFFYISVIHVDETRGRTIEVYRFPRTVSFEIFLIDCRPYSFRSSVPRTIMPVITWCGIWTHPAPSSGLHGVIQVIIRVVIILPSSFVYHALFFNVYLARLFRVSMC